MADTRTRAGPRRAGRCDASGAGSAGAGGARLGGGTEIAGGRGAVGGARTVAGGRRGVPATAMLAVFVAGCLHQPSPYATHQSAEVKALSVQEVDDYLTGRGLGLVRGGEAGGQPAPAPGQVLELAGPLSLTPDQRERTEALSKSLQHRVVEVGRVLIDEERALDRRYAARAVTAPDVERALVRIAAARTQLKAAHDDARRAQIAILSPAQLAAYERLRDTAPVGPARRHP